MRASRRLEAARRLAAARLEQIPFGRLPGRLRPRSSEDAYAIQDLVHDLLQLRGIGRQAGHKIGCTTPVMQEFLGIPNPCAGGVFAPSIHRSHGSFDWSGFRHVGVECELSVSIGADVTLDDYPLDAESIRPFVRAVAPAIEVVDDRYVDYPTLDTWTLVADDFFGSACVIGHEITDWQGLDLRAVTARMAINAQVIGSGVGSDILGDPLIALAWLANNQLERARPLREGEIVLLGSLVPTQWVARFDEVEIQSSLGGVTASFH